MYVTILPSLLAISTLVVNMFLVSHMISQKHVTKGSCDFRLEPFIKTHHPAKSGDHRHCGSGYVFSC